MHYILQYITTKKRTNPNIVAAAGVSTCCKFNYWRRSRIRLCVQRRRENHFVVNEVRSPYIRLLWKEPHTSYSLRESTCLMIPFSRWDLRYFASITCVLAPLRQPGQEGFMAAKHSVPVLKVLDRSTPSKIETWNYSAYLYRSKAYIINTFVESNLAYLDSYFPATDKYLKKIEELVKAKLRGSSLFSACQLCHPLSAIEYGRIWSVEFM